MVEISASTAWSNPGGEHHMSTESVPAAGLRKAFLWVTRIISYLIYVYLIVVEIVLFLGFFLLLFGANPSAGFTEWVYRNLDRAMAPFRGIFTPIELGTTNGNNVQSVFETSVLFAMIVYGILALVFSAFLAWLASRLRHLDDLEAEIEARQREEQQRAAMQAAMVQPTNVAVTHTVAATPAATTPTSTMPTSATPPTVTPSPNPPPTPPIDGA